MNLSFIKLTSFILSLLILSTLNAGGGHNHHVLVRPDGTMWAWGSNEFGQLGTGDFQAQTSPVEIGSGNVWTQVSRGQFHNIALDEFGRVWTWGLNKRGQLGTSDFIDRNVPTMLAGMKGYTKVTAGAYHSVALKNDGNIKAWGENKAGQLGDGTNLHANSPVTIIGISNVADIAAGAQHTLAIRTDGMLHSWGSNGYGQLGAGTDRNTPSQVDFSTDWQQVKAGLDHSMAIKSGGNLYTWGKNNNGQLGLGHNNPVNIPTYAATTISDVNGGAQHSSIVTNIGQTGGFGANVFAQLGDNPGPGANAPSLAFSNKLWAFVDSGEYNSILESGNGEIYSHGRNNKGQAGTGMMSDSSSLTNIFGPMSRFKNEYSMQFDGVDDYISIGDVHAFERTDGFTLSCWLKTSEPGVTLFSKINSGAGYIVHMTGGALEFQIRNTASTSHLYISTNETFNNGKWHHVAITYDGSSSASGANIIIDGISRTFVINNDNLSSSTISTEPLAIGAHTNGSALFFKGVNDEYSIWNKALTINEVLEIYNQGNPTDLSIHSVSSNLIGWWRMGDGDTYPSVKDESGQGNDGAMTNMTGNAIAPTYPGFNKNAVSFDGLDDYIDTSDIPSIDGVTQLSVFAWVNFSQLLTDKCILAKWDHQTQASFALQTSNTQADELWLYVADVLNDTGVNRAETTTANFATDIWYHVGFVYDGSLLNTERIKFYIDGVASPTSIVGTIPTNLTTASSSFKIGKWGGSLDRFFPGKVDETSIWNKALTTTEVSEIYAGNTHINLKKTSMSDNLVGWWRMGDGDSYPNIKDHSITKNDGLMINMGNTNIIDSNTNTSPSSGYLYWIDKANDGSNDEHIVRSNLDGSANTYIFTSPGFAVQNFGSYLNVTNNYLYWVQKSNDGNNTDYITRANLDGSGNTNIFTSPGSTVQNFGSYLNVTDTYMYWVQKSNDGNSTDYITRANLDGSGNTNIFTSPGFAVQNFGSYLNVTDTYMYWVQKSNDGNSTDYITRANLDGSGNTNIFTSPGSAVQNFGSYLNVTDTYMYWVQKSNDGNSTDELVRANLDGSGNTTIFTSPGFAVQNFGSYLTVTDSHIYWVQKSNDGNSTDELVRANLDGSGNTTILSSPGFSVQNFGYHLDASK